MGRKKKVDVRRQQILEGLFHTVVRRGFANCTITEISEASSVSRGILHYYFKNKKEMLLELMKSLGETHYQGILRVLEEAGDVREKLKSVVRFQYMDQSKPFHDTAGVWVEFWGQVPHDPEVREVVGFIQVRLRGLIADLIQEGVEQGAFRRVNPRVTASVIMSMMEGPTLQWVVDRKGVDIRQVSATLEDFIVTYLDAPGPEKA